MPPNPQWWKHEARALRLRLGFLGPGWKKAALVHLLLLLVFGVGVPYLRGIGFLDPVILGAYAALGAVFAAPAAATPFDGPVVWIRTLARVVFCSGYGMAMGFGLLLSGVLTVYLTRTVVVGPDLQTIAECGLFGLGLAAALSSVSVWVTLRFSPALAKTLIRIMFLALLLAFVFYSGFLPAVALLGASMWFAIAGAAQLALRRLTRQAAIPAETR